MEGILDHHDTLDSRQFVIAAKRLANDLGYGTDPSPFLGSGIEYVQSRQYQPGDPIRAMDWKVTARTGKHYVKEYEAPKRLPCYLLVDTSASMTISSHRRSKYAVAVFIAGGLAFACLDRVSPVGLIGVGSRDLRIEPSLSKDQIMQWLHRLRQYRYDEGTTLASRIFELSPMLTSRALVVVLSDLHDPRAAAALKRLSQEHDVVVLQLRDPAERRFRGTGFVRAQEGETGRPFLTHGRKQWGNQSKLERELSRGGIDHLVIDTDEPFAHRLRYFFGSRHVLGRGAR